MKNKTWKVLKWSRAEEWKGEEIPLQCEHCGRDAMCPVLGSIHKGRPIFGGGMGVVFDTDPSVIGKACFPEEIQCRGCRRAYSNWGRTGEENLEKEVSAEKGVDHVR